MKIHDTLIHLLLDLVVEMRNRYNARVEIEYYNENDIYLFMYFTPAGFGVNYRIDITLIEKEYKYVSIKDLADHISVQVDRMIVEHFKKGKATDEDISSYDFSSLSVFSRLRKKDGVCGRR